MDTLFPVLLSVPLNIQQLQGRDRVQALSHHSRRAVHQSAELMSATLGNLAKNEDNVPLPSNGWYWSVSHKQEIVAGVVAPEPIGIDVEIRRPVSEALCRRIADPQEWDLAGGISEINFFRFWTAKEAVLKAVGIGMKALSQCRITELESHGKTRLNFKDEDWSVVHFNADPYIATVTDRGMEINWTTTELEGK